MAQTTITGITGGEPDTVVAAYKIEGGVANKGPQYTAEKKISNTTIDRCQGVVTIGDVEGKDVNITGGGGSPANTPPASAKQNKPKSIKDYSVTNIEELLREECFPDPVVKKFVENGIDGKYFLNLLEEGVLEALDVTNPIHKMKIKTLIKEFSEN